MLANYGVDLQLGREGRQLRLHRIVVFLSRKRIVLVQALVVLGRRYALQLPGLDGGLMLGGQVGLGRDGLQGRPDSGRGFGHHLL